MLLYRTTYQFKVIIVRKITMTIMKSSQHQALVKYFWNPRASHLINISRKKITVKIRSM